MRSLFATWERGDFSSPERWAAADIEWIIADGPVPGRWKGVAGMEESFLGMLHAWDDFRIKADEYRELDDARVLVLVNYSGRGKISGLPIGDVGAKGASIYELNGGQVTRAVTYYDRDRAFADLGLEAETMPEEPATPDLEEISRKNIEALNRGEIDAGLSAFRPDAVLYGSAVDGVTHEGLAAIREFLEEWMGSYEDFEIVTRSSATSAMASP
jgi:ketosteroid isomerase-like protein